MALVEFRIGNSRIEKIATRRLEEHQLAMYAQLAVAAGRKVAHERGIEDASALEALRLGFQTWGVEPGQDAIEWVQTRERALEELREPREPVATVEPDDLPPQSEPLVQRIRRRRTPKKLTEDVELRVNAEQLERWKLRATKEGISVSELLRRTADETLDLYDATERQSVRERRGDRGS